MQETNVFARCIFFGRSRYFFKVDIFVHAHTFISKYIIFRWSQCFSKVYFFGWVVWWLMTLKGGEAGRRTWLQCTLWTGDLNEWWSGGWTLVVGDLQVRYSGGCTRQKNAAWPKTVKRSSAVKQGDARDRDARWGPVTSKRGGAVDACDRDERWGPVTLMRGDEVDACDWDLR